MRITREIFDNDKLIMHVNYDKIDLAKIRKKVQTPDVIQPKPIVQQKVEQPVIIDIEKKEDK